MKSVTSAWVVENDSWCAFPEANDKVDGAVWTTYLALTFLRGFLVLSLMNVVACL